MIDFKAQLLKDLRTFHNAAEFATVTNIWYDGEQYTVPVVIDHEAMLDRQITANDHGEGIEKAEAVLYMSLCDVGITPKKGRTIEIEEAGAVMSYQITRSDLVEGEIILELGAYCE